MGDFNLAFCNASATAFISKYFSISGSPLSLNISAPLTRVSSKSIAKFPPDPKNSSACIDSARFFVEEAFPLAISFCKRALVFSESIPILV